MKKRKDGPLPLELVGLLADAIPDAVLERERVERLRERVLEKIHGKNSAYLTIPASEGEWRKLNHLVAIKVLHQAGRFTSMLLKLEPGAELPSHVHAADEECLVLEGEITLGEGVTMTAGDYHRAFKGAPHAVAASTTGALLFLRSDDPAYLP
ncbi:MAG: cupin domain-containing protein [Burkholderiales bacterium]